MLQTWMCMWPMMGMLLAAAGSVGGPRTRTRTFRSAPLVSHERGSKKLFVVEVANRSKKALLAVVRNWVLPGTTIYTDCWKAYDKLAAEGFPHYTVNHSRHFVYPVTGVHTPSVERAWKEVQACVPREGRRQPDNYGAFLCEFLWT
jgi:transposase